VYGGGREAMAIALDRTGFERMLEESDSGVNTLIKLEGNSPATGRTVIAKELQREPVRGGVIHVDFYEVDLSAKIEVSVPIHLTGTAAGVVLGGVLDQQQREVELLCLPNAIPDEIEFDISSLELGDSLHVDGLVIPADAELVTDSGLTVATVLIPRGLQDEEDEAADAEAEAGEGEGEGESDEEGKS
jgi:large subunit ribosomal protein L25